MNGSYRESSRRAAPVLAAPPLVEEVEEVAQRKQGSALVLAFTKNQAHPPQSQSHSHRSLTLRPTPAPLPPPVTVARTTAQLPRSTCPVSPPLQPQPPLPQATTTSTPASKTSLLRFQTWTHLHAFQEASEFQLFQASDHCKRIFSCLSFSLSRLWLRRRSHLSFMVAQPPSWVCLVGHGLCRRITQRLRMVVVVVLGWAWVPLSLTACGPTETLVFQFYDNDCYVLSVIIRVGLELSLFFAIRVRTKIRGFKLQLIFDLCC